MIAKDKSAHTKKLRFLGVPPNKSAHTKNQRFLVMLRSRKAQMEMIGLVVIVILITLGMLFMATFALKDNDGKKIFTRKGLAYSTISAVMKTTINDPDCSESFSGQVYPQVGKDLIEDCAYYYQDNLVEGDHSLYRCGNKQTCIFLEETISEILNETLGGWNKNYEFKLQLIESLEADPLQIMLIKSGKGGCWKKEKDGSGLFPLHTDQGIVEGELSLCD